MLERVQVGSRRRVPVLDRPILVTGTPCSGKSCIAHRLRHAPELHLLPEPLPIWNIGVRGNPDDRRLAEEAIDSVRRDIRRACERVVSRAGKSRYLDDLAYHALRIAFVHRVVPDAKIVFLVRDPEQVIPEMTFWWSGGGSNRLGASITRGRMHLELSTLPRLAWRFVRNRLHERRHGRRLLWGPCVPGLLEFAASHTPAETAAFQWQGMMEIALNEIGQLPARAWIEVRFERLMEDPSGEIARVAEFCELGNPQWLADHARATVRSDWPNPFVSELSASDWESVRERIDPLRRRLGYV